MTGWPALVQIDASDNEAGMTISCVILGWKVEQARKQREAVAWVHQMVGSVEYEPGPKWLREQFGVDFFGEVVMVSVKGPVSDVSPLAELKSLEVLKLVRTEISDVKPLAGLAGLERLVLLRAPVTDVSPLARLTRLRSIPLT